MAAKILKVEQVGPKEWKFERLPGGARLMDKLDDGIDLMEAGNDEEAEKIFREIIKAFPQHIDARHHLALLMFYRGDLSVALELWGSAVEIGSQSLPEEFVMGENRLEWGWLENRPFLRACHGLGLALFDAGRVEAAHLIYNRLLAMNPNDNQGVRASAIESAFAMSRPKEVLRICNKYKGDCLADSLYGRPLAFFQLGRKAQAEKALISAIAMLPLIARELLKKRHRIPKAMSDGYLTVGGPDEAYEYWQRLGKHWKETEGALAFLAEVMSRYQKRPSTKKH